MQHDTIVEMGTSRIRYGKGVTAEVGPDLKDQGKRQLLLFADPFLSDLPSVRTVRGSLDKEGLEYNVFDRVHIEPTDDSVRDAIAFASQTPFDAVIAVGGGSTIDTAKAAVLYATYPPADFLDYVNVPVGKAMPPPGPLPPLVAIPTTAGTGSEVTGVAVMDFEEKHVKTGISHPLLKPTIGLVDPANSISMPPAVTANSGLDVLCHAAESFTTIEYTKRPRPERPRLRPPYQGANPISDIWSLEALRLMSGNILRAYKNPEDEEARGNMMLAASYAGLGFGNAGCHWCHAMSYPIGGMIGEHKADGYPVDYPLIPHGTSVIISAPATFRFTAPACPERHMRAAEALGVDISGVKAKDVGEALAARIIELMRALNMPNGLSALGFTRKDIPQLVAGTLLQQRLIRLSPRPAEEKDIVGMFEDAMTYW